VTAADRTRHNLPDGNNGNGDARTTHDVLVVGDESFESAVRQAMQSLGVRGTLHSVGTYLMALGYVGRNRPTAVVGQASALDETASATGAALRHLAPSARLLLVAEAEDDAFAAQAVFGGFDDCLAAPATPQDIAAAMAPAFNASAVASQKKPAAPQPTSPPSPGTSPKIETTTPASQRANATTVAGKPPTRSISVDRTSTSAPPPPQPNAGGDDELGDIDLVELLLRGGGDVASLAMRLVAARSGIAGVQLVLDEQPVPQGFAVAPIVYESQAFGQLAAPRPASSASLVPWAAWLARWLALDQRTHQLWDAAYRDELTGVWNRRYFDRYLGTILDRAIRERFRVTVMIFDIDDFKTYNDRYGHPAGDEILRETARLMRTVVRDHDVVARIGGDEFGVIFWDSDQPRRPNSQHPLDVRQAAMRFRKAIRDHQFPKLHQEAPGTLTISGGLAGFPWDGRTPEQLVELADARALQSKRQGKNAITFGPGADFDVDDPI
jgi:diguanylate cyclase (GGDEF)-like protein